MAEATQKNENDKVTMSGTTFNEMKRRFDLYPEMLASLKTVIGSKTDKVDGVTMIALHNNEFEAIEQLTKQAEGK